MLFMGEPVSEPRSVTMVTRFSTWRPNCAIELSGLLAISYFRFVQDNLGFWLRECVRKSLVLLRKIDLVLIGYGSLSKIVSNFYGYLLCLKFRLC